MKKYKILLAGKGVLVVNDFFFHTEFECQSTSMRYEDMNSHVKYFKPDAFVYCMQREEKDDLVRVISLKEVFETNHTAFVIIGDRDEVNAFNDMAEDVADLSLQRPMSITAMKGKITRHLKQLKEVEERTSDYDYLNAPMPPIHFAKTEPKKEAAAPQKKAPAKAPAAAAPPSPASPEEELRRKHIVVVDDDPRTLKLVKGYLQDEYDIATAISGKLALKFLENKPTDLIVLDYEMPGQNGVEVFKELKKLETTKRIPIVFLTGVDNIAKVREILALKPQGYLLKPIEREQLLSAIKGLIG